MTRNVLLVVMDTARFRDVFPADSTAAAADDTVAPRLESLAGEGTRFDRAFTPSPWTLPAHASLFTGTVPSRHGATAAHPRLHEDLATLPAAFRRAGYETVAVSNNTWVSDEFGFGRGFERFHRTWQYVQSDTDLGRIARTSEGRDRLRALARELFDGNPLVNVLNAAYGRFVRKRVDSGARRTNAWLEEWLADRDDGRPFFLFANYLEPHLEYRPPEEAAAAFLPADVSYEEAMAVPQDAWSYVAGDLDLSEREFAALRGLYRGEIAYLDGRLAELLALLEAAGVREETLVVVTSDHGENVGDHGLMDHQYCLYDTVLHVPLVVHGGPFTGRGVDDRLASLVDLVPTLLDVADVEAGELASQAQGTTLRPGADDERERVFAEYLAPQPSMDALETRVGSLPPDVRRYDRALRAVRTADWKLVRGSDGTRQSYAVGTDPAETDDRADGEPERVAALEATLDDWLGSFDHAAREGEVPMASATRERLEDLGYLRE